ncbi:hypothetical protein GGR95_002944 [Sulfitobacter undariae]|uniref:GcrA cell cycle regulator n=1 Tax=Sulfitobacter undariae TaxID=1563671 RepID=A0A7W6E6U8_9RHOB|nr:hypothetical protein [Sulfitobacter undariae]MBB3995289.1 hypothetical protein [Sulfitobacter undariae]
MNNLAQMQVDAAARLARASCEAAALSEIGQFGERLSELGIAFEVLPINADRIEISVVIGGFGDERVQAAVMPQFKSRAAAQGVVAPAVVVEQPVQPTEPEKAAGPEKPAKAKPMKAKSAKKAFITGPWSEGDRDLARKMIVDGFSNGEIAKKLGRHAGACNFMLKELRELVAGDRPVAPKPVVKSSVAAASIKAPVEVTDRPAAKQLPARIAAEVKAPVAATLAERPYAERVIISHLDAVGYAGDWNAERDLELVEEICRGSNLAVVATELQIGFAAAQDRWRLLNSNVGDLQHQKRLVAILKERANA